MKFFLDRHERFALSAKGGGWELSDVKGKIVHYCLTPVDAVKYMTETLREDTDAVGVREVVEALTTIEAAAGLAATIINFVEVVQVIGKVIGTVNGIVDVKQRLVTASASIAGCTEAELRVRADRHEIVARAKAILEVLP